MQKQLTLVLVTITLAVLSLVALNQAKPVTAKNNQSPKTSQTFTLHQTTGSNLNWISTAVYHPSFNNSKKLTEYIQTHTNPAVTVNHIKFWNSTTQSFIVYTPGSSAFPILPARAYEIDITLGNPTNPASSLLTLSGFAAPASAYTYNLSANTNWIVSPPNQPEINTSTDLASFLEAQTGYTIPTVSYWNPAGQSLTSATPNFGVFNVTPGQVYRVVAQPK